MTHADTTISIVTYSALAEAKRCLQAVLASRGGAKLILTANGTQEAADYFETLAMREPNIEVVVNTHNLGFIVPSNHAFGLCDTEWFVLINDDAVPPPDWLAKLKVCFDHDKVAIAGPGDRWLNTEFIGHRWRGGMPIMPDYIEGSCMMVRVSALHESGEPLFWEELQIGYCEDAELCLRMRAKGYTISVADFSIFHKSGTTSRTVPELHDAIRGNFVKCKAKWSHYLKTRTFA